MYYIQGASLVKKNRRQAPGISRLRTPSIVHVVLIQPEVVTHLMYDDFPHQLFYRRRILGHLLDAAFVDSYPVRQYVAIPAGSLRQGDAMIPAQDELIALVHRTFRNFKPDILDFLAEWTRQSVECLKHQFPEQFEFHA